MCLVSGNPPIITVSPQNHTVLITSDNPHRVTFKCHTAKRAHHTWITIVQGNQTIVKSKENKHNTAFHYNVSVSNNGTQVYCEATNGSGMTRSEIATLTILG